MFLIALSYIINSTGLYS